MRKLYMAVVVMALAVASVPAQSQKVYITPKGKKYHLRSCKTLNHSTKVIEVTVAEAKRHHLEPCKVCNPGDGR